MYYRWSASSTDRTRNIVKDENNSEKSRLSRQEIVALSGSLLIIGIAVVYWGIQIEGVMELLEMAYG